MATYRKRGKTWRAEVERRGVRRSSSFDSKAAAVAWAGKVESEIMAGVRGEIPNLTFSALLTRYAEEVSVHKKGSRWESVRIKQVTGDAERQTKPDPLALVRLRELSSVHTSAWRDRRLKSVAPPSVRREWNLLSHACNVAVNEWKWLTINPFKGVKRPRSAKARYRIFTDEEIALFKQHARTPARKEAYRAILVGNETGMRASEIVSNPPITGRVAFLEDSKNGTSREVPLSEKAAELMAEPFTIGTGTLDTLFRDMRAEAGLLGGKGPKSLHFHDTRHTAATNLSRRLNMLQLAKMLGIKDPRILMIYYNESSEDIAKKL